MQSLGTLERYTGMPCRRRSYVFLESISREMGKPASEVHSPILLGDKECMQKFLIRIIGPELVSVPIPQWIC